MLATAAGVAAFGLVDVYRVPLSWWRLRRAGLVHGAARLRYRGLSACPRTSSTTTGTSVVFGGSSRRSSRRSRPRTCSSSRCSSCRCARRRWALAARRCCSSPALLWTHSRAALPRARRSGCSCSRVAARGGRSSSAGGRGGGDRRFAFVQALRAHRAADALHAAASSSTRSEHAHEQPAGSERRDERRTSRRRSEPLAQPARRERDGRRITRRASASATPASTAARTDVTIKAGESTYTELGVETGLLGGLVFVAWSLGAASAAPARARVARAASPPCSRSGCRPT